MPAFRSSGATAETETESFATSKPRFVLRSGYGSHGEEFDRYFLNGTRNVLIEGIDCFIGVCLGSRQAPSSAMPNCRVRFINDLLMRFVYNTIYINVELEFLSQANNSIR